MNKEVNISVIIPTYKRYQKVLNCVNSLIRAKERGYESFEVIVVDDGGNMDRSIESKVSGLDIKWIYNEDNMGQPAAQATGVKVADGKILAFLDDDAEVDENWLLAIENYFQQNADIYAVLGRIEPIDETHLLPRMRQKVYDRRDSKYRDAEFVKNLKEKYNLNTAATVNLSDHISGGNFACRKELLDAVGGFRTDIRRNNDAYMSNAIMEAGFAIGYNSDMIILHHHGDSYRELYKKNFAEGRNYVKAVGYSENNRIKLVLQVLGNFLLVPFRITSFPDMLKADRFFLKPYLAFTGIQFFDALGRIYETTHILFSKKE